MLKSAAALAVLWLAVPSVAQAQGHDVALKLTYNVTPNGNWAPGSQVLLSVDARHSAELGKEDIFFRQAFPGSYPRKAGQQFDIVVPGLKPNDVIIVQGYMCAASTSDCYPSDKDNPPSCSVRVTIQAPATPSCQPVFTWTGGDKNGGVICSATCQ